MLIPRNFPLFTGLHDIQPKNEVMGGILGAVVVIPTILGCGFIVAQPLGQGWEGVGVMAAFGAAIGVALLRGLLGTAPLHLCSPKTTYAALVSALTIQVAAMSEFHAEFADPQAAAEALLAIGFLITIVSGMFQLILGSAGLGGLIKYVPHPVVAGFVNGFALHIIIMQIPVAMGCKNWSTVGQILTNSGVTPLLGPTIIAIFATIVMLWIHRLTKIIPSAFAGLLIGTVAWHALGTVMPSLELGRVIGDIPSGIPFTFEGSALKGLGTSSSISFYLANLMATAFTLALISSIQSLLSATGADALYGTRHDGNRELQLQGLGNVLAGLVGGMPSGGSPSVTCTTAAIGARHNLANLIHGVTLLVVALGLGAVIGRIPLPVMAAVVIVNTVSMRDGWTKELLTRWKLAQADGEHGAITINLATVLAVALLVVTTGVLVALAVGMIISFSLFVRQSGQSVVRRVMHATHLRSRTARSRDAQQVLATKGGAILMIEVQGPVFFGSVDQLINTVDGQSGIEVIILDVRRVTDIDSSGAMELKRMDTDLAKRNCVLLMAGLPGTHPLRRFFTVMGFTTLDKDGRIFPERNSALSAAEDLVLAHYGVVTTAAMEIPLADVDIMVGFSADEIEKVRDNMVRRSVAMGTRIISERDPGDRMFLLVAGRVVVRRVLIGSDYPLVIGSYRRGIVFGEMAMLSGQPRTADVVAESDAIYWEMDQDGFNTLAHEEPVLYGRFLRNISINFISKISTLNDMVYELEAG